ncbi:hypothetical protein SAMN05443634_10946 [Chishuiella changwenlii]|uniref:Lipoprotein n=1 Tax=Chishuiella changwenlii TaxID=1434701 RepID=A0A1M7AJE4_9FLAO|nr:hypothetical protein [Chishuiella changwenlii]GGE90390.1 hypothetical protein GCM10010984_05150 [Chishuiella changwenlii]SHL42519.1 hypothetical protein SAMN05443634_10946 [Chishuiella changwenlii]
MKKFIILAILSVTTFTVSSCSNNDDSNNGVIENRGNVTYDGFNLPIRNVVIEDMQPTQNGISYIVELSSNPINYNGRNSGAYIYLEIFQANGFTFSGEYNTSEANFNSRSLDFIEFHVDPLLQNGVAVEGASTFAVYDNYFASGTIRLENYDNGLLVSNFLMTDLDGRPLRGNFEGLFEYIQHFNAIGKVPSNPTLRKAIEERKKTKGDLKKLRAEKF